MLEIILKYEFSMAGLLQVSLLVLELQQHAQTRLWHAAMGYALPLCGKIER